MDEFIKKGNSNAFRKLFENHRNANLIDLNFIDSNGEAILHLAAKHNREEIVKICLQFGADPYLKNRKGKIAVELTKLERIQQILKQGNLI
jgi:ankyrin repeat protein